MSKKFETAKVQLNQYKEKFYKNKNSLQQDHDSFVKIKDQTMKELKDQIDLQSSREVAANEDLMEKADLQVNATSSKHYKKHMIQSVDIEFEGQKKSEQASENIKKLSEADTESSQSQSSSSNQ